MILLVRKLLPVHFLTKSEVGREEEIMREWLEVLVTESGLVVAQQTIQRPPLMVAQMTEEWLNYYRKIAQSNTVPGGRIFFSIITIFQPPTFFFFINS